MLLFRSPRFLATLGLCTLLAGGGLGCSAKQAPIWSVGAVAPEIEGSDLDDMEFKLSDFRGKVVMLEFWGNWWGPCRSMYPHNRAFLERYANEPFEIVGVNSDTQRDSLRVVMEKQKIGWRSFWNGPKGPGGPISKAWGVDEWPTICMLDSKGVIRYRASNADIPAIEEMIQKLLAELAPAQVQAR
jgi:thiol-disulfide isomerase/thioredoxin